VGLDGEVTSKVGPSLWRLFYESIEKLPKFQKMKTAIVKAKEEGNTLEQQKKSEEFLKYMSRRRNQ